MVRLLWMTLAFLTLAAAPVAACDFAAPVPGPAHFYIFDAKTGAEADIAVAGRWLGAGCELSNPFAYIGESFAWSEGPEKSGASQDLYLRDSEGGRRTLTSTSASVLELSLTDTHAYYLTGGTGTGALLRKIGLSDGRETAVPVAAPAHAMMNGATLAWFTSDGERLHVYDADKQEWIRNGETLATLGVPNDDQAQLHAVSPGYLLFSTYLSTQTPTTTFRFWTYDLESKTLREAPKAFGEPRSAAIDADTVYAVSYQNDGLALQALRILTGKVEGLGSLPHELPSRLVVVGSKVVLASYRHEGAHAHHPDPQAGAWTTSRGPDEGPFPIPSAAHLALLALGFALALRRAKR